MTAVSVKVFHAVVAGAAAQGVDPAALLAAAGLAPEDLADPDGRLPHATEARLWHEAVRLTGDDAFGLHLSERLQIDTLGPLGFAVRSSATLGEAYARVSRYMRLIVTGLALELVTEGDVARLRHHPPRGTSPARHAVEFLMGNLVVIGKRGMNPSFTPRAVRFRHAAPARADEHRRVLGPGVRFGAEHDELVLDRALLDAPQTQGETALAEVLDQHLASRLAALPAEGGFLERVRAALAAELSHGEPALAAVAARVGMSPRSLQRRLAEERSSLSALLDGLRADLAVRYLCDSSDAIAEVAFRLGFSEVSTFHRAFKRWTGRTPATYRRERAAPQTMNSSS